MNNTTPTVSVRAERPGRANSRDALARGMAPGIALIAIGSLAVFSPLAAGLSLAYLITAGLGLYGAAQIVVWAKTPPERRGLDLLVNGILTAGLSLLALWASFQTRFGFAGMIASLSVAAAFLTLLRGIGQFFAFSRLHSEGTEGAGWVLAAGMLNALLAVVILSNPLMSWFAISTVWGIYLGALGVALTAEAFAESRRA